MNRLPLSGLLATLAVATAIALPAQQTPAGFASQLSTLPATANSVHVTADGTIYFDGTSLLRERPGQPAQTLLQLPSSVFGSFTISAGEDHLLFGESSFGDLWLVPLDGSPATQIANLPFNYDAVPFGPDRVLVSAKITGFSTTTNDLVIVDLVTGAAQSVAVLEGASGPLALDANGHVYYATSSAVFPSPLGAVDVLRLPRGIVEQALSNGTVLDEQDADVVFSGLDAAGALAFDDDGDLFYTDFINSVVGELRDADAATTSTQVTTLLDYTASSVGAGALQFVPAAVPGLQVFEPFQPNGGSLHVTETDFFSQSRLRRLTSLRATIASSASAPIASGPFDLAIANGPANGFGLLGLATASPVGELALSLTGFEAPLLIDGSMAGAATAIVLFDGFGRSTLPLTNPGFAPAIPVTVQAVHFSLQNELGSSASLTLQVGQ